MPISSVRPALSHELEAAPAAARAPEASQSGPPAPADVLQPAPAAPPRAMRSALEARVLRLHPGEDLRPRLEHLVADAGLAAAAIVTCVGSLQQAVLRMAGAQTTTTLTGPFEIVSLVGTLGAGGSHLHIALADAHGQMVGGHVAATGCIVHTTAEIVLGVLPELHFAREPDPRSGCQELVVRSRDASPRA